MKFAFVVATKVSAEQGRNLPINKTLGMMNHIKQGVSVDVCPFYNNKRGLATVYNEFLDDPHSADYDYIVFIHDDVWLNDVLLFQKIMDSKFDVMGPVGGCYWGVPSGFDVEHKPLIWTVATCERGASGFMNHDLTSSGHLGVYLPSSYGPAPLPTASLDGCCLILNKHAVEKGLRFDSEFDRFDFYDHALVQSALKLNLKVGTVPILCTHGSVGAGVMNHTEEYLKYQKKFIQKYFT